MVPSFEKDLLDKGLSFIVHLRMLLKKGMDILTETKIVLGKTRNFRKP